MTPSPSRRSLTVAAVAFVTAGLLGGALTARERTPRAPQAALAHAESLTDARRTQAPTSAGLLVERLTFLGMTETDANRLAAELGSAPAAELKARVADAGLTGVSAEKAVQLLLAIQQGRPVAHVGLELDETLAEAAWDLTTQGTDPDAAAWAVSRPDGTVELDGLPAREVAPSPAIATCKTCPQIDYMLTPTTTRRVHSSSVEGSGCVMYRFTVQPGRTYRFSTCTADGGSAAFDTLFTTWTTQCVPGPSSDDACGTASRIDVTPTVAGYLFLRVSAVTGSGAFTLSYQDLGTLCRSCPAYDRIITSIPPTGGSLTDSVPENGCKTYRFTVQGSRVYRFTTCPAEPGSLDTVIETFTSNCNAGPSNDDACVNNGSEVVVVSPTSSYIYVRVRGFAGDGGSYTLRYDDATDECHACPIYQATATTPTYTYRSYPGAVLPGECYTYKVPLVAGRTYRFSLCSALGGGAGFQSQLEVSSPDCGSTWSASGQCGLGSQLTLVPAVTGDHFVTVRDIGGTGGTYTLIMGLFAAACPYMEAPALVPTQAYQLKSGEIEETGQVPRYPLAVQAGRIYRLSFCDGSGGFGPAGTQGRWLNPSCGTLAGSLNETGLTGSTFEVDCVPQSVILQNAVTRTLPVEISGPSAGAFAFGYKEIPCHQFWVAGASEPPVGGQNYSPNPVPAGAFTQFRIQVTPNRSYTFSLCAAEGGSANFNSRIEIYSGSSCTPMAVTRTICGDDEKVTVLSGAESFLIVRTLDEANVGGTFTMNARRNP